MSKMETFHIKSTFRKGAMIFCVCAHTELLGAEGTLEILRKSLTGSVSPKTRVPGWAQTTNLSVKSRTRQPGPVFYWTASSWTLTESDYQFNSAVSMLICCFFFLLCNRHRKRWMCGESLFITTIIILKAVLSGHISTQQLYLNDNWKGLKTWPNKWGYISMAECLPQKEIQHEWQSRILILKKKCAKQKEMSFYWNFMDMLFSFPPW